MQDPVQGQPAPEPAAPIAQGQPPVDPAAQIDLTPYLPEGVSVPAAPAQPSPVQGQPQIPPDAPHFQQLYNRTLAENFALQRQIQEMQQQRIPPSAAPTTPPPDPNTDWAGYMNWTIKENNRQLLEQFRQTEQQNWQTAMAQASEMEWSRQHPGSDINQVKAFALGRGIQNLDDALTLMNLPQMVNQVRQSASAQTMQSFRTPVNNLATPLRPGAGAAPPVGLSWNKLAQDYQQTNGKVYESWPPELQKAFDAEWALRETDRLRGGSR